MKSKIKQLHFSHELIPLILEGKKTATWRLWDDKNLEKGDLIEILESGTDKSFGFALVNDVVEKEFSKLKDTNKLGHEKFKNDDEMYKTFTKYYKKEVTSKTSVKILHFKLLKLQDSL